MGRPSPDAKDVRVLYQGRHFRTISRLIFTGHSFPGLPADAVGVLQYLKKVFVVREDADGVSYIETAEAPIRDGGAPLTRRIIYN